MFFVEKLKFGINLFNLPSNFEKNFYKSWAEEIDSVINMDFQRKIVSEMPNEDVRNHLLATTEFGQEIQSDIDLYITRDRLNQASFRTRLDPIAKNVIRNQNPLKLVFKHIKHFDGKNPVTGSLIRAIHVGKKDDLSKLLAKAPSIKDLEIRSRLEFLGSGNNNDNFQPPPKLPRPPQPPRRDELFQPQAPPPHAPRQNDFLDEHQ